jgi:hypothetical protein
MAVSANALAHWTQGQEWGTNNAIDLTMEILADLNPVMSEPT